MRKPANEFIKGQKIEAVEEFSREIAVGAINSLQETYEILSPEDTEEKNKHN